MSFRDRLIQTAENDPKYIAERRAKAERSAQVEKIFAVLKYEFENWLTAWFREVGIQPVPVEYKSRTLSSRDLQANLDVHWEAEGYKFEARAAQKYVENKRGRERKPVEVSVIIHISRYGGCEPADNKIQLGRALIKERDYVPLSPAEIADMK